MTSAFTHPWRLWLTAIVILCGFGTILARLYHLQILEQDRLEGYAEASRKSLKVHAARRGNIVDRHGVLLATSRPLITVGVDPQTAWEKDAQPTAELAQLLNQPLAAIQAYFTVNDDHANRRQSQKHNSIRWRKIADGVSEERYETIRALGIPGVYGNRHYQRAYPNRQLAAHILGFINKDGQPVQGVERAMDFYLRGLGGWRETERDGSPARREMTQFRSREVQPVPGLHVELTIDAVAQHYVEEEIDKLVATYRPEAVTIIISEPATGYLLALGNHPSFDPNTFWRFPLSDHRSRFLTDIYEPGSIFKIVTAAGALNEGLVSLQTPFDCSRDSVSYQGQLRSLPNDHKPFGWLSFEQVLIRSSNRGTAQIGMLLGAKRLHRYAWNFGFGQLTDFCLIGEVTGVLPPLQKWDGLTITRLPIGHAVSATSMQVHCAMGAIANQGVLMTPQIIRRVFDQEGETVLDFAPRIKRRVIAPQTAKVLSTVLAQTVLPGGTATLAAIEPFIVAGKTGTTRKIVEGQYSSAHHIASFSGFFPAPDPQVVITVIVDEPQLAGSGYGGTVAAPAFRNLGEKLIAYLAIQPRSPQWQDSLARKLL